MCNLPHCLGDFARLLKMHFTTNEGMSNDAPIHPLIREDQKVKPFADVIQRQHFLRSYLKTVGVAPAGV